MDRGYVLHKFRNINSPFFHHTILFIPFVWISCFINAIPSTWWRSLFSSPACWTICGCYDKKSVFDHYLKYIEFWIGLNCASHLPKLQSCTYSREVAPTRFVENGKNEAGSGCDFRIYLCHWSQSQLGWGS